MGIESNLMWREKIEKILVRKPAFLFVDYAGHQYVV